MLTRTSAECVESGASGLCAIAGIRAKARSPPNQAHTWAGKAEVGMTWRDNGDNRLYYTMYRCVSAAEWRRLVAPFARPGRDLRTKDVPAELRILRWEVLSPSEAQLLLDDDGWPEAWPA